LINLSSFDLSFVLYQTYSLKLISFQFTSNPPSFQIGSASEILSDTNALRSTSVTLYGKKYLSKKLVQDDQNEFTLKRHYKKITTAVKFWFALHYEKITI